MAARDAAFGLYLGLAALAGCGGCPAGDKAHKPMELAGLAPSAPAPVSAEVVAIAAPLGHLPQVPPVRPDISTKGGEPGHWPLTIEPDAFDPSALLDLRYLNEAQAGEHGFIAVDANGDFQRGDGVSIRFWAVGSGGLGADVDAWEQHGRFLAKRGVNLVRWHGNLAPKRPEQAFDDFDHAARDELWACVAGMKRAGIYTMVSPYYPHATHKQPGWDLDSEGMGGLLFVEPRVQAAYKAWLRAALVPPNPHTGVPLKDEPALAILQMQNEDSLLFWTTDRIAGRERARMERAFHAFVTRRYGSIEQALSAFRGERHKDDAPEAGRLGLYPVWDLTGEARAAPFGVSAGKIARVAVQTEFWIDSMHSWNRALSHYLRAEVGAKQVLNFSNWRPADPVLLMDGERYAASVGEVLALNRYVVDHHAGPQASWSVRKGDRFRDGSLLRSPARFPLALKQVEGKAMIVPESNWVPPISHRSEGPFLVAAYLGLTGVDALFWFQHGGPDRQFRAPSSANGFQPSIGKWVAATPDVAGNYPAAALLHRNGYVRRGRTVVHERRALASLFQRESPVVSELGGFDPNRDRAREDLGGQDGYLFLLGPIVASYAKAPGQSEAIRLDELIDEANGQVVSVTGELTWDFERGVCVLDAPCVKGATGALRRRSPIPFDGMTLTSDDDYASVLVVSLDTEPLTRSQHVLVQIGTRMRPTGFRVKRVEGEAGQPELEILDHGRAPWQVVLGQSSLTLRNERLTHAFVLDLNGMPRAELPLSRRAGELSLVLPADAMYVVLRGDAPGRDG